MVDVAARLARSIGLDSFADLTPVKPTRLEPTPDGRLVVRFPDAADGTPLVDAATLALVQERMETRDDDEIQLRRTARTAYDNNAAYLAQTSYTNAQVVAQVAALTRQMQAVIRLLVEQTPAPAPAPAPLLSPAQTATQTATSAGKSNK